MMKRLMILNVTLVAVLIAMSIRVRSDWKSFDVTHQTAAIQPEREAVPKIASTMTANAGVAEDWTDIPSHNPFSFDRTDIPILEPVAPPKPPGVRPILFGTISLGKEPMAMVASGQPAGNRNYRPMRVGEVIDGWTITEILDKSITIKADQVQDSVLMSDPTAQVPRESTRTAPAAAPLISTAQPQPASTGLTPPSAVTAPPPAQSGAPPKGRRRILQQTPFGVREIEVDD